MGGPTVCYTSDLIWINQGTFVKSNIFDFFKQVGYWQLSVGPQFFGVIVPHPPIIPVSHLFLRILASLSDSSALINEYVI